MATGDHGGRVASGVAAPASMVGFLSLPRLAVSSVGLRLPGDAAGSSLLLHRHRLMTGSIVPAAERAFVRRALIVEDDAFSRSLIGHVLDHAGFETRLCATSADAIEAFEDFDPDVLVADIQLGAPPNGAQLAVALAQRAPYLGVVLVSNFPAAETAGLGQTLPRGAAFLHKREIESPELLLEAIESTLDDSAKRIVRSATPEWNPLGDLSAMQLATLQQIALGRSNAEIARRRGTSLRSVERLISRLFDALGIPDDPSANPRVVATRLYIDAMGVPRDDA